MQSTATTEARRPVDAPTDHLGRQAIVAAHRLLQADDAWTQWHGDGFTWWAHRLAQRFRFEGPVDVNGAETWWVGSRRTACAASTAMRPRR